jgi:hypothetical protein
MVDTDTPRELDMHLQLQPRRVQLGHEAHIGILGFNMQGLGSTCSCSRAASSSAMRRTLAASASSARAASAARLPRQAPTSTCHQGRKFGHSDGRDSLRALVAALAAAGRHGQSDCCARRCDNTTLSGVTASAAAWGRT